MLRFREWLCIVEGRVGVPPGVLQGYEYAFRQELERLIQRTQDPVLRKQFEEMLECPIVDSRGNCHSFTSYAVSALVRQGLHTRYDLEAALGYVFERMLMPSTNTGEPRSTLFTGFDPGREYLAGTNPLQARFLTYLGYAIRSIRQGKVPRVARVERRPQGTVSIGVGRRQEGDPAGGVSPDQIAAPPSGEGDFGEMVQDILGLLRERQRTLGLPLVPIFQAMLSGVSSHDQRQKFGDRPTRAARPVIVQTIQDYARSTGNVALLNLLQRFEGFDASKPTPLPRRAAKPARPVLSDQERDYRSIADVVARSDGPVGTSQLGRFRRRWLEYPPRDAGSGYRNRMEEVLAAMVRDGVLKATRTAGGATFYSPGPGFDEYQ